MRSFRDVKLALGEMRQLHEMSTSIHSEGPKAAAKYSKTTVALTLSESECELIARAFEHKRKTAGQHRPIVEWLMARIRPSISAQVSLDVVMAANIALLIAFAEGVYPDPGEQRNAFLLAWRLHGIWFRSPDSVNVFELNPTRW